MKRRVVLFCIVTLLIISAIPVFANGTIYSFHDGKSGRGFMIVKAEDVLPDDSAFYPAKVDDRYIYNKDGERVGYWQAGKRSGEVISEYKPYIGEGKASVKNGLGVVDDGGWVTVGDWSRAAAKWTIRGINKAYYDYR
ncbi:hypothetical protein [Tepidimicrobium xylanilyticum]